MFVGDYDAAPGSDFVAVICARPGKGFAYVGWNVSIDAFGKVTGVCLGSKNGGSATDISVRGSLGKVSGSPADSKARLSLKLSDGTTGNGFVRIANGNSVLIVKIFRHGKKCAGNSLTLYRVGD